MRGKDRLKSQTLVFFRLGARAPAGEKASAFAGYARPGLVCIVEFSVRFSLRSTGMIGNEYFSCGCCIPLPRFDLLSEFQSKAKNYKEKRNI